MRFGNTCRFLWIVFTWLTNAAIANAQPYDASRYPGVEPVGIAQTPEFWNTEPTMAPTAPEERLSLPLEASPASPPEERRRGKLPWFPIPIGGTLQYERIGDDGGWGIDRVEASARLLQGLPGERVLFIRPTVAMQSWQPIASQEIPEQFYDFSLSFAAPLEINDRWSIFTGITPGFYSDGSVSASEAFRLQAMAFANYKASETLSLVFGVIYVGREDISAIPIAGFQWRPADNFLVDFAGPKPRISRRWASLSNSKREWWSYIGGEFSGGQWAYLDRSNQVQDLAYQDMRLVIGIERLIGGKSGPSYGGRNSTFFFEAGYLFNREIEVEPLQLEITPTESYFLRTGISF